MAGTQPSLPTWLARAEDPRPRWQGVLRPRPRPKGVAASYLLPPHPGQLLQVDSDAVALGAWLSGCRASFIRTSRKSWIWLRGQHTILLTPHGNVLFRPEQTRGQPRAHRPAPGQAGEASRGGSGRWSQCKGDGRVCPALGLRMSGSPHSERQASARPSQRVHPSSEGVPSTAVPQTHQGHRITNLSSQPLRFRTSKDCLRTRRVS